MTKEDFTREQIVQWYEQYGASLFKYIIKIVKDVQQTEDLVQDTFIKAHKYLARGQPVDYPKTFLFRVAHNLAIDYLRKKQPIYIVKDFLMNKKDPNPSVEALIEFQEDSKELYEALRRLKSSHRQVIILRKIEAFSIQETAQILNWSAGKVKTTLYRALRHLEKQFTERGTENETP